MKFYAHVRDGQLIELGVNPHVEGADRVELTIEQAKSLLSGETAWTDWEVTEHEGQPALARVNRELKFLESDKRLERVLTPDDVVKTAYVYLTLHRRPFALVGEREVTSLQARRLLKEKRVDLWQVKK